MKKKIFLSIFTLFAIICLSIISNAMEFDFIPDPTEKEVHPGDTVEIKLNLKNVKDIEEGINTIVGNMSYEDIYFSDMKFEGKDQWSVTYNNIKKSDLYGKFAITTIRNGVTTDEQVATLTLTLKENLLEGETDIHFTNLVSSDGEKSINEEDRIVKLMVKKKPQEPEKNKEPEQKPQNIKTGDKIVLAVGIIVLIVIVWAVVIIVMKKKDKNEKK